MRRGRYRRGRLKQDLRGLEERGGNSRGRATRGAAIPGAAGAVIRRAAGTILLSTALGLVIVCLVAAALAVEHTGNLQSGFRARPHAAGKRATRKLVVLGRLGSRK